jgi:hypothetical protein
MSPNDLLQESDCRAASGDWGAEALEINKRLVEVLPDASLPLYRLGRCLLEGGRGAEGRVALRRAVTLGLDGVSARVARRALGEETDDGLSSKNRFVSPPRDELHLLARPMNDGERVVFEFFDRHLPIGWEIYVEPHLNGLRPDIVLLNPKVGIAVFEVKDWDLDAFVYEVENRPGRDPLIRGRDATGRRFTKTSREDPFAQAALYREEIARLYCPSLDEERGIAAITAGVIFPAASDARVLDLFTSVHRFYQPDEARDYWRLAGRTTLDRGAFRDVLPSAAHSSSRLMTDAIAEELRHWLVEPDVARDQRSPPKLSASQQRHVDVRDGPRFRRLKGPAGSGKSAVLAARADSLEEEGKDVLVLTYNLTLPNYLRDLASAFRRSRGGSRAESITWLSFHEWCRRQAYALGYSDAYKAVWRAYFDRGERKEHLDSILGTEIAQLVALATGADSERGSLDAILIDEGQDWLPDWFSLVRKNLRPGGEVFFVADAAQDLYERAPRWTDGVMSGVGFRGDWRRLSENHRLPQQAAGLARSFAAKHLQAEPDLLPMHDQLAIDVDACALRWVQTDPGKLAETCLAEIDLLIRRSRNEEVSRVASWSDLFLVFDQTGVGLGVVEMLTARGIEVHHTFDANKRAGRSKKLHFYKGDARAKATTIHSFKGWEAREIIVVIASTGIAARKRLYAGLTRLKRSDRGSYLTIVCADPSLVETGQEWPEFHDGRRRGGEQSVA